MNISVIIPAFNAEKFLRQSVESVLTQDFEGTFEIIIINDCSTDGTVGILETYQHDPRIRVFHTEKNGGYPTAMNLGLSHAIGHYICRMDADDVMNPNLLRMTYNLHESMGRDVAFVSCKRYWISYSGKPYYILSDSEPEHRQECWNDLINRSRQFTDVGSLYLRSLAGEIGGYNTYERSGMDVDFWLRIMEHTGKPCLTLSKALVGKRLIPASIIFNPKTTLKNNIPRELALYRRKMGLPANHRPTREWLATVVAELPEKMQEQPKVGMSVDIALINLWLRDYRGFLAFMGLSLKRNPMSTIRILLHHSIFGWFHDFIDVQPKPDPIRMELTFSRAV
jgi:glycosyltransferase involved in cell wall biosynthesis